MSYFNQLCNHIETDVYRKNSFGNQLKSISKSLIYLLIIFAIAAIPPSFILTKNKVVSWWGERQVRITLEKNTKTVDRLKAPADVRTSELKKKLASDEISNKIKDQAERQMQTAAGILKNAIKSNLNNREDKELKLVVQAISTYIAELDRIQKEVSDNMAIESAIEEHRELYTQFVEEQKTYRENYELVSKIDKTKFIVVESKSSPSKRVAHLSLEKIKEQINDLAERISKYKDSNLYSAEIIEDYKKRKKMEPTKYKVVINTTPPNARVAITNIKQKFANGMSLPSGKYDFKVSAPGYEPDSFSIQLKNNLAQHISLTKRSQTQPPEPLKQKEATSPKETNFFKSIFQ